MGLDNTLGFGHERIKWTNYCKEKKVTISDMSVFNYCCGISFKISVAVKCTVMLSFEVKTS